MKSLIISPSFFEYDEALQHSFSQYTQSEFIFYDEKILVKSRSYVLPIYFLSYVLLSLLPNNKIVRDFYGHMNSLRKDYSDLNNFLIYALNKCSQSYDNLIIIKSAGFSLNLHKKLQNIVFNKRILVLYDPLFRYPETITDGYNKIFSTEMNECMERDFEYLSLFSVFFDEEDSYEQNNNIYFCSFIGTFSIVRLLQLIKINLKLRKLKKNKIFVLISRFFPRKFKLFGVIFSNRIIDISERKKIILNSEFVLSLEEPGQWSWTGRIGDTICLGGRIVSNSKYVNEWRSVKGFKGLPVFTLQESIDQTELNDSCFNKNVFDIDRWIKRILE